MAADCWKALATRFMLLRVSPMALRLRSAACHRNNRSLCYTRVGAAQRKTVNRSLKAETERERAERDLGVILALLLELLDFREQLRNKLIGLIHPFLKSAHLRVHLSYLRFACTRHRPRPTSGHDPCLFLLYAVLVHRWLWRLGGQLRFRRRSSSARGMACRPFYTAWVRCMLRSPCLLGLLSRLMLCLH